MNRIDRFSRRLFLGGLASGAATPFFAQSAGAAPRLQQPGVYVEEVPSGVRTIEAPDTSATLFVDLFGRGKLATVRSLNEFEKNFGARRRASPAALENVRLFFGNGGRKALIAGVKNASARAILDGKNTGLRALLSGSDLSVDFICVPPAALLDAADAGAIYAEALELARKQKAMLLVDAPQIAETPDTIELFAQWPGALGLADRDAAMFAPRLNSEGFSGGTLPASGAVAGVVARTDAARGVWKAPAGMDAAIRDAAPEIPLSNLQNEDLNKAGVNAIRTFPSAGNVIWGARTLSSDPEWKYIPVRRTALFIEKSLDNSLEWAVFEPNDEPLWAQIRASIENFMTGLWRAGAFQGATPKDAYFVQCGRTTTTQLDIDKGVLNIEIGFAPLKLAEFIIIRYVLQVAAP